jgi:hypothetical protein
MSDPKRGTQFHHLKFRRFVSADEARRKGRKGGGRFAEFDCTLKGKGCKRRIIVRFRPVETGVQKSCGCLKHKQRSPRFKDETGKVYGNWKVLRLDVKKSRRTHIGYWRCRCLACRKTVRSVAGTSLRNGTSTGCGCERLGKMVKARVPDLVGKLFGRGVVLDRQQIGDGDRPGRWRLRCFGSLAELLEAEDLRHCHGDEAALGMLAASLKERGAEQGLEDCGQIYFAPTGHLNSGHTQSCGCWASDATAERNRGRGKLQIGAQQGHLTLVGRNGNDLVVECSNHDQPKRKTISRASWKGGTESCGCKKAEALAKLAAGPGLFKRKQKTVAFIPTAFQRRILDALTNKALTADNLQRRTQTDRKDLYNRGLNPLRDAGLVLNNRRVGGYYRPDLPPDNLSEFSV